MVAKQSPVRVGKTGPDAAELRVGLADVRTDMTRAIDRQTRWIVSFILAWSTILLAAARLLY